MARKENFDNNVQDIGVATLNEITVGKGGNNSKRSDVQLVQFFLRQFYKNHPELFKLLPKTKSKSNFISIDGINGPQTEAGILLFQKSRAEKGNPIKADGLVSVANSLESPTTNTIYTIHLLNAYFRFFGDGKEHIRNLENHPDIKAFAPELQAELSQAEVEDRF